MHNYINGEGFRTLAIYRLFYRAARAEILARQERYDQDVRDWYESGDGAPKQWVTETFCGECGDPLKPGVPPFQRVGTWYSTRSNLCAAFCSARDGGAHLPMERTVNIGGQGYTYPECIHGASRWTDYDNICYGCEESETAVDLARSLGRERFVRFIDRWEWAIAAPGDAPHREDLLQWAYSLWPKS